MNPTLHQQGTSNNREKPLALLDKSKCFFSEIFAAHALVVRHKALWLILTIQWKMELLSVLARKSFLLFNIITHLFIKYTLQLSIPT